MKNMVVDEVCHTPIVTSLAITFIMNKTFLVHHLFNEDGKDHVELLKGEKLNQILLKFAPLCPLGIRNLVTSFKHCFDNLGSLDYISY